MELRATLGDITTIPVDAVVNAANDALIPGGGVDGAINRAAGPELGAAMRAIGGCRTGQACITPAFNLPAKYVIHAVGPIWRGGAHREAELLASAYRSALALATTHDCRTVSFPAISTGVYGYPLDDATRVAVETMRALAGDAGPVRRVIFVCYSDGALAAYRAQGVIMGA
jgi:O-acetyl-ADP-ribose deacetylase